MTLMSGRLLVVGDFFSELFGGDDEAQALGAAPESSVGGDESAPKDLRQCDVLANYEARRSASDPDATAIMRDLGVTAWPAALRQAGLPDARQLDPRRQRLEQETVEVHAAYYWTEELTLGQAATKIGITIDTLRKRFRTVGLAFRGRPRPSEQEIRQTHDVYWAGGLSLHAAAAPLGVHARTLKIRFEQLGLRIRPTTRPR